MVSREDVATFLKITPSFLRFILYGKKERKHYRRFQIPKRTGGFRHISAPPQNLSILQRKVANILLELHKPKPSAHGFLRTKSIATNASAHAQQRHVFNVDLKDFFPTIHFGRFKALLLKKPFSLGPEAALTIAQICFEDSGLLPQGAPSSPIVSNIVARQLDDVNQRLAKRHRCIYTRYADDLTFSTSQHSFPQQIARIDPDTKRITIGDELLRNIEKAGFVPNLRKVRLQTGPRRREVTGLTVDEIPNVLRRYVREIDSVLHNWSKFGKAAAAKKYHDKYGISISEEQACERLPHILLGKLGFLEMVKDEDDPVARRLRWQISDMLDRPTLAPPPLKNIKPIPLRGLNGRFRGWKRHLRRLEASVFFVLVTTDGGEEVGSAFVVAPNVLATAGHIAEHSELKVGFDTPPLVPERRVHKFAPNSRDIGLLYFPNSPFANLPVFRFQYRIPEVGEEVATIGYPRIPLRDTTIVLHSGTVEAIPVGLKGDVFIQTSFPSGGGLSGAPLIDQRGLVVGVMTENVFMSGKDVPGRPYGQATPFEYLTRLRKESGA